MVFRNRLIMWLVLGSLGWLLLIVLVIMLLLWENRCRVR